MTYPKRNRQVPVKTVFLMFLTLSSLVCILAWQLGQHNSIEYAGTSCDFIVNFSLFPENDYVVVNVKA